MAHLIKIYYENILGFIKSTDHLLTDHLPTDLPTHRPNNYRSTDKIMFKRLSHII